MRPSLQAELPFSGRSWAGWPEAAQSWLDGCHESQLLVFLFAAGTGDRELAPWARLPGCPKEGSYCEGMLSTCSRPAPRPGDSRGRPLHLPASAGACSRVVAGPLVRVAVIWRVTGITNAGGGWELCMACAPSCPSLPRQVPVYHSRSLTFSTCSPAPIPRR